MAQEGGQPFKLVIGQFSDGRQRKIDVVHAGSLARLHLRVVPRLACIVATKIDDSSDSFGLDTLLKLRTAELG
ncbi:hypothetical protein GGD65_004582 [Bradyrhizobium sp. CIR18]|nr:hypothetical protein [Bradyrhizobium sp. CIR18]